MFTAYMCATMHFYQNLNNQTYFIQTVLDNLSLLPGYLKNQGEKAVQI